MDALHRHAERQHGVVTFAQSGLTRHEIATRIRRGDLEVCRRGVFRIGGSPRTWEQAVMAACLAGGAVWSSHDTAARVWRLRHAPPDDALHVTGSPSRRLRLEGVVSHRSILLPADDVTRHRGLPVTSVPRTLAEVGGSLGGRRLGEAVDDALRRGLLTLEQLRACHARLAGPGRRRLRDLRRVLNDRLPGYDPGDSDLEVRALRALVAGGLPLPVQQHRVVVGGRRYRLDLAYPHVLLGIELLGWAYHGSRTAFDADRLRTAELVAAGWTILEFTSRTDDADLVRLVRTILDARAA